MSKKTKDDLSSTFSRRAFNKAIIGVGAAVSFPAVFAANRSKKILKFACIVPLTGPSAAYGIRTRDGAIMAAEHYNKASDFLIANEPYAIEIDYADMANDARQAITLARQYAGNSSYLGVLGLTNSVGYVATVPVAGQLRFPIIGGGSAAPVKKWNTYAYRVNPVSEATVPVMLKTLVEKNKIKRLAVIFDQTQDGQLGEAELCRSQADKLGYEVVAYQSFRSGDQDLSPQIATIRNAKPDAIYVAAATGDGVRVVSQIKSARIEAPLLTGFGSFLDSVYWDGTNGQTKDGYTYLAHDLSAPTGNFKAFIEQYNKQFKQEATSFSAYGYDTVAAAVEALKIGGKVERESLTNTLTKLNVVSPIGTKIRFENPPSGNNLDPTVVVIKITGRGTYEVV